MIHFTCSNCGTTFDADETQPQLQCMNCGAIYRKNPQPQRQVQSQPQQVQQGQMLQQQVPQGQMPQQQVPQSQSSVYNNQQMSQNVNLQSQVQNQQIMQNNQQIPVQNQQSYNQSQMNMPNQQQYNNMQGNIQNQQYYNNQQVNMQGQPQVNMQNHQNMNVTAPSQQPYNNNQQIPRKKNNTGKIVGAVIGGIAILIIAVVGLTTVMKKAQSTKIDTEVSEIVNELPTNAIESEPSVAESSVATSESSVSESVSGVEESSVASESTYEPSSSTSDNMYSYYYHGITFKMNYDWYSNLDLDDSDGSLFIMPEEYDGNFGIFIYYDQSMDGITYNTFDSDSTCLEYVTTIANTIELTNTQYKYQLGDNAHTFIITGYDDTNGYAYILDLITKDNHEYTFVAYGYSDFDANIVNQAVQDFINNSDMISVLGL